MRIYVASSWRCDRQPEVVAALRNAGHEVYDFRSPAPGDSGFHWSEIDPDWKRWTSVQFREGLRHPIAAAGFKKDFEAMQWADIFVLVMPCGRSAHLEAGWAAGRGTPVVALLDEQQEPELMLKLLDAVCCSMDELLPFLSLMSARLRELHSPVMTGSGNARL